VLGETSQEETGEVAEEGRRQRQASVRRWRTAQCPVGKDGMGPLHGLGASVQPGGGALDAFTIFTEEGPELRATTQGQRDTTIAARA
jgi:hypothetical protein